MTAEQPEATFSPHDSQPPMLAIEVELANRQAHLQVNEGRLCELVRHVLEAEGVRRARISLAIVDDATMQQLHRRFLNVDSPTDVLSFPLDDDPLEGEVVVNAQQAVRVAARLRSPCEAELLLYVVHGTLHLCGYDDRKQTEAAAMRKRQSALLAHLGVFPGDEVRRGAEQNIVARRSGEE